MAATGTPTPNIGLRIPQGTDPASVDDINYNSNLLDTKLGAVGSTSVQGQIDSLNSNMTKRFLKTSTGDNRNGVLHTWMNDGIRSALAISEMACMVGLFQGNTYYGIIVKVTDNIMMGHMFIPNYGGGFYFRDNSTDSTATSNDFTF